MIISRFRTKKLYIYLVAAFFLAVFSFGIYALISRLSLADSDAWDGVTIATEFSGGNGTAENPYIIRNAPEFMYFKNLIEGDNSEAYQGLYYVLGNDIDFGQNSIKPIGVFEGESERVFAGHFDGAGHSLHNFKIDSPTVVEDKAYYSLFTKTKDASIERIALDNYRIEVEDSEFEIITSPFIGMNEVTDLESEEVVSIFQNIALKDFYIDYSKVTIDSSIFAFMGDAKGSIVHNIYLDGEILGNQEDQALLFFGGEEKPEVTNFVNRVRAINNTVHLEPIDSISYYYFQEDELYQNEETVSTDYLTVLFNEDVIRPYYWDYIDNKLVLCIYEEKPVDVPEEAKSFTFSISRAAVGSSTSIVTHASGLDGNTFYINDFDADYNYMKGLNFTEVRGSSLPTNNTGFYSDNYLVRVQIIYDGVDINNSSRVGALSPVSGENNINKFVYYKYYALERNSAGALLTNSDGDNYIRIELIDNPFSKRPYVNGTEYGFNGWVCNQSSEVSTGLCENASIGFKKDNYTRYMEIPVVGGSDLVVHLNASWTEADVVTSSSDISTFNSMSMQPVNKIEYYTTDYIQGRAYWKQNYTTMVFSRTYVRNDGFMPRGIWYKTNQYDNTYTYVSNTTTRCGRWSTCYAYTANTSGIVGGTEYVNGSVSFVPNFNSTGNNSETTVYYYDQDYMNLVADPTGNIWDYVNTPHYDFKLNVGDKTAGYFYQVNNPTNEMIDSREFYDANGNLCTNTSGTCAQPYKLIQYNDTLVNSNGNSVSQIEEVDGALVDPNQYYYLVTRDTNIFRYTSNTSLNVNNIEVNRPFTVTGNTVNSTNINGVISMANELTVTNDLVLENIRIYGPNSTGSDNITMGGESTGNSIFANSQNLKIGRNVVSSRGDTYIVANRIYGGLTNNVSGTFRVIVESGKYYAYHSGPSSGYNDTVANETTILGSDYDRVNNNNSKLWFLTGLDGFSNYGSNTAGGDSIFLSFTTLKSGMLGFNTNGEANTDNTSGIYIGGWRSSNVNSVTGAKIEGGRVNILLGGYGFNGATTENSSYIGMSGGEVRQIYGGAGHSTTKGNRIINVTGGKVNYSILGGSDSYSSSDNDDGVLQGDTLIYVGGTVTVGTQNDELYGVESGSVFGAGGGRNGATAKGTVYDSHVIINGGTINKSVYGGGNYGSVGTQKSSAATATIDVLDGTIVDSVYGGSKAAGFSKSNYSSTSTVNVNVYKGKIGNIYGGSNDSGQVYGSVTINVLDGTVTGNIYGGGKGNNTYVDANVNVVVGSTVENHPTVNGNVYGGSAYGTVNSSSANGSAHGNTNVHIKNGVIKGSVFGGAEGSGSYTPHVQGNITVTVDGGSIGKVFGGFDAAGQPNAGDVVYLNGGTIGDAFGGGNNTGQSTTNINLQGSTITGNLYGGSNLLGTVTTSNVNVTSGTVTDIYGGNNLAGSTGTTNVSVTGGTINGDIYGGGNEAPATTSNVTLNGPTVHDVYGGCKKANLTTTNVTITSTTGGKVFGGSNITGTVSTSHVNITSSQFTSAYGGNNQGGGTNNANIETTSSTIGDLYGGGDNASSTTSHVTVHSGTITNVFGGGKDAGLTTSNVLLENGTITNVFGGSNNYGDITVSNVTIGNNTTTNLQIGTLYGGNNLGGVTTTANINGTNGTATTIFGGGNQASVGTTKLHLNNIHSTDIYGGGNEAGVTGDTLLDLDNVVVENNIYGGGNEGIVEGDTVVTVTDSHIKGNAFAGGNGSTAIVYQNSTITIDGDSEIGTSSSQAPNDGCVFGSGNAASTGLDSVENSHAIVNIVGGEIHGNVYGGPKMAVVYGTTKTNIGTAAVNQTGLIENDILIHGTVFGGGESNASGSETYDWTFISVTEGIDVMIDGTGYEDNNHQFVINGSIFGSGNASSSAGTSNIYVKNLGTIAHPNISVSIQRANHVVIDNSVIELLGAKDRTNEFAEILYSFNIIDDLVIKNDTVLLLQHNANLLKKLYSGVDSGGLLVPATVTIDENTGNVTRNVDNRIYMIPGQNLNVTINQAASAYGEITGMTFFGMYNSYGNGSYRYGLYDRAYSNGDVGNASLEIVGGSYVVGLRKTNHDITKDGFYTNTLEDDYTRIVTNYIDPTKIGETGYRWVVGFEAINYEFTLIASKYSSLGTYELPMIHFADGNTRFNVLGFDGAGLHEGLSLVNSNVVPRIGATETEANSVFGLSMKAETQEWTGYGTTKMLTQEVSPGKYFSGTEEYLTDNRKIAPSMMFYLYHAKNITAQGPLGTVVVTMQAAIPKNEIEYDIKFITITIHLTSVNADSDSYDASITYDKKYEMPSSTSVNITNTSQFSTYYSLTTFKDQFSKVYGNDNEYFHVLVTNYPLPVNTMITMIDYGANDQIPNYYYFKVTQAVYNDSLSQLSTYHEITYRLSNFIKMDSTSSGNHYDDATNNLLYYDTSSHLVDEEFIFIFDFKECSVTGNHLDNSMLFELRNSEDRTIYNVLGAREGLMFYSTYESSNAVLSQTFTGVDSYLYYNVPDEIDYSTEILYDETENRQSVIDTNYESRKMGLNVIITDRDGEQVSSSLLLGTSVSVGNQQYFADGDGVFRIKLSNKVSNLHKTLKITANSDLPAGQYTVHYTLFASDDGLHNSDIGNSVTQDFVVQVVSSNNSITVDCEDKVKVVDGETGLNMLDTRINTYHVKYESELENPNFRVEIYKRNTDAVDSTGYTSVPFNQLFTNSLSVVNGNEVSISMNGLDEKDFAFELQQSLTSGTYRVVFKLYDSNHLIDEEIKYVIVKKKVE